MTTWKSYLYFFGKVSISKSNKPKAESPVNVFGKITGVNIDILLRIRNGEVISLKKMLKNNSKKINH